MPNTGKYTRDSVPLRDPSNTTAICDFQEPAKTKSQSGMIANPTPSPHNDFQRPVTAAQTEKTKVGRKVTPQSPVTIYPLQEVPTPAVTASQNAVTTMLITTPAIPTAMTLHSERWPLIFCILMIFLRRVVGPRKLKKLLVVSPPALRCVFHSSDVPFAGRDRHTFTVCENSSKSS